jgi:hypothetical protein
MGIFLKFLFAIFFFREITERRDQTMHVIESYNVNLHALSVLFATI